MIIGKLKSSNIPIISQFSINDDLQNIDDNNNKTKPLNLKDIFGFSNKGKNDCYYISCFQLLLNSDLLNKLLISLSNNLESIQSIISNYNGSDKNLIDAGFLFINKLIQFNTYLNKKYYINKNYIMYQSNIDNYLDSTMESLRRYKELTMFGNVNNNNVFNKNIQCDSIECVSCIFTIFQSLKLVLNNILFESDIFNNIQFEESYSYNLCKILPPNKIISEQTNIIQIYYNDNENNNSSMMKQFFHQYNRRLKLKINFCECNSNNCDYAVPNSLSDLDYEIITATNITTNNNDIELLKGQKASITEDIVGRRNEELIKTFKRRILQIPSLIIFNYSAQSNEFNNKLLINPIIPIIIQCLPKINYQKSRLFSVVTHIGTSISQGHYITYIMKYNKNSRLINIVLKNDIISISIPNFKKFISEITILDTDPSYKEYYFSLNRDSDCMFTNETIVYVGFENFIEYNDVSNNDNIINNNNNINIISNIYNNNNEMSILNSINSLSLLNLENDLTNEELININKILTSSTSNILIVSASFLWIPIYKHELRCLMPKSWLNDQVLNFYYMILQVKFPQSLCFNTFFYSKLTGDYDTLYNYKKVERWTKNSHEYHKLIYDKNLIIIPINILNEHWTTIIIKMKLLEIHHYDSLGRSGNKRLKYILQWLKDETNDKYPFMQFDETEWRLIDHKNDDTPLQNNGYDCGMYQLLIIDSIINDIVVTSNSFSSSDVVLYRQKLCGFILRYQI
jgi:hypothetical protein